MCMEDVRIARASKGKRLALFSGTGINSLPGNAGRLALVVSGTAGDTVALGTTNQMTATNFDVICFLANNSPVVLELQNYGDWLRGEMYVWNTTGAGNISIFETWLDKDQV